MRCTFLQVCTVLEISRKLQLKVNGWISIAFCSPEHDWSLSTGGVDVGGDVRAMRPYHTLLLGGTNEGLLQRLPTDCSTSLYQFVQALSPLITFGELAIEIDVSLAQVFRFAQHLISWKEGRLIHPIAAPNVYVVSPQFDVDVLQSEVAENFARSFNRQRLSTVLVLFSQPCAFGEHMAPFAQSKESVREQQLLMVQWLLRRNVLTQLHTYIFFTIRTLADPFAVDDADLPLHTGSDSEEGARSGAEPAQVTLEEDYVAESITPTSAMGSDSGLLSTGDNRRSRSASSVPRSPPRTHTFTRSRTRTHAYTCAHIHTG